MKNLKKAQFFTLFLCLSCSLWAQEITQTIRGNILDKDSKIPLIGANISLLNTNPLLGTTTDFEGNFRIEDVKVGRQNIQITYLGYESMTLNNVMVISGKELVLNIELQEATTTLEVATVTANDNKKQPLNEMATVSARTFSVEETSRYASSLSDPARMAQSFAGVQAGGSDDLFNEIIIRGNSPRGVLWRLEGIEIPNPNHFGSMGNSGGAISMLSSSTLSNSDFYTGAFPSEFGNATSGVFDLRMRNGNNEQREYALMIGLLGLEAAAEGPFKKGGRGSYLVNYRYSTLAALSAIGLSPAGDILPAYSDLSFKLNMPTEKAGTFSIFGLGGQNQSTFEPTILEDGSFEDDDEWGYEEEQKVGTIGLSHRYLLSNNSYIRTVAMASYENYNYDDYWLNPENDYNRVVDERTNMTNTTFRISSTYTKKFNARNTFQTGLIFSNIRFDLTFDDDDNIDEEKGEGLVRYFDNTGKTNFIQGFAHWKHRFNKDWTLNGGVHYSQMTLNNNFSIEPRLALQWQVSPRHRLSASAGLHSKMEHLSTYVMEGQLPDGADRPGNRNLELSKSLHTVLGYDFNINENWRLKTELYYQHLFDIPVESTVGSTESILNTFDIWGVIGMDSTTNAGTGRNVGIDVTLEKFFANNYYFMFTGSLYDSKYKTADGREFSTRFNGNYQVNFIGGKEFKVGKKKQNIIGLNARFVYSGGNRFTPIDLESSIADGEEVRFEDRRFEERSTPYWRADVGLSYKINKKKMTHTIRMDIQNVTSRLNQYSQYFDEDTNQIEEWTQTGLFPVLNYRIEF